jgi:catechol 2,3-dioxygenase-like lactoylglutathione lyase family enzyme
VRITASAISLNVDDPQASADFVTEHFGFEVQMAAEGFVSLSRPDAGFNLVYLETGLPTFKPPALAGRRADGLLVVFEVSDVDAEYERLTRGGVAITTPIETEEWGERFFQVTDPCGVVLQLVQWADPRLRSPARERPSYPPPQGERSWMSGGRSGSATPSPPSSRRPSRRSRLVTAPSTAAAIGVRSSRRW